MKKLVLLLGIIAAFALESNAQQISHYTMFMFNKQMINPAYVGSRNSISIHGLFRRQWVGLEGSPTSYNAGIHSPIGLDKELPRVGLGLLIFSDKITIETTQGIGTQYSYRIPVGEKSLLHIGLMLGFIVHSADYSELSPRDPLNTDPLLKEDVRTLVLPTMGTGLYLYNDNYYVGLSASRTSQNAADGILNGADENQKPNLYRHYWLMSGVKIKLSDFVDLKPNVIMKAIYNPGVDVTAPFDADFNLSVVLGNRFLVGASYRLNDSFDFILEMQVTNQLRAGYAYDFTTGGLHKYVQGSHEIMLGLDLNKTFKTFSSPRFVTSF